jgi:hypothetical protein
MASGAALAIESAMIERIIIMVLAVVLAVPEYAHETQRVDAATRGVATAAAREIVETLLDTLDFEQVLDRDFDVDTVERVEQSGWFERMLGIKDTSQIDRASIRRAYAGFMNVFCLWTIYQVALESPDSGAEVPLPPDVAAVIRAMRFLPSVDEEDIRLPEPGELGLFAEECDAFASALRPHLRMVLDDPGRRAQIVAALGPAGDEDITVEMGAGELGVPEETRVVWVRFERFAVVFGEGDGALRALGLQHWD